jgi:hypothetical protein
MISKQPNRFVDRLLYIEYSDNVKRLRKDIPTSYRDPRYIKSLNEWAKAVLEQMKQSVRDN